MKVKNILKACLFACMTVFISCKKTTLKNTQHTSTQTTLEKPIIKKTEDSVDIDSIRLKKVLDDALEITYQNIKTTDFKKKYSRTIDSAYNVTTKITIGSLFIEDQKHVIIRNESPMYITYNIYAANNNSLRQILSYKIWTLEFVSDSIADINGDHHKDFIVNWHGSSGCCLKAFSNVYLFQPDKKTFTNSFRFTNPTFSAKEKIVRGVCYGHAGETEIYKFAWNTTTIDTLEYVSYEVDDEQKKTGKVIISNGRFYKDDYKIIDLLEQVPEEYHTIYGYDWFTGDILDN